MTGKLTELEMKMLRVLGGLEELDFWGAWCTATLESLGAIGFATFGPKYQITPAGRAALAEAAK